MKKLRGISASPGIAIQRAYNHYEDAALIPRYIISESIVKDEKVRFHQAVSRAAEEIKTIKERIPPSLEEQKRLLDVQLFMLQDPDMIKSVEKGLTASLRNVEWILADYADKMTQALSSSQDEYLAERSLDIIDVKRRITNHLLYRKRMNLAHINQVMILVTTNLLPSETIQLNPEKVRGIAMDAGGRTSHTAILARSFGIPAVLGLRDITRVIKPEDLLIIDGNAGIVIVDPDKETLQHYRGILQEHAKRESLYVGIKQLPAVTKDGKQIILKANIEIPDDIESVKNYNAEGIGLFRSEFLFMDPHANPDEERQYTEYVKVLKVMGDLPVTIRTLDVGGDKLIHGVKFVQEKNPLLGCRAIRYCLGEMEFFRRQLRALLRASVHGRLKIMFPLISCLEEMNRAKEIFEEEKHKLTKAGIPIDPHIPLGIMIEVPSAAMIADILAREADFFSLGTNDLIQYTLAVDRGNEQVASLYQPSHPGVLRLIDNTVRCAHKAGIPVGMCGEMANDPLFSLVLLGLGLDELSMGAFSIPVIKRIIRSVTLKEAEKVLDAVMRMTASADIDAYLSDWMGERFDFTDR